MANPAPCTPGPLGPDEPLRSGLQSPVSQDNNITTQGEDAYVSGTDDKAGPQSVNTTEADRSNQGRSTDQTLKDLLARIEGNTEGGPALANGLALTAAIAHRIEIVMQKEMREFKVSMINLLSQMIKDYHDEANSKAGTPDSQLKSQEPKKESKPKGVKFPKNPTPINVAKPTTQFKGLEEDLSLHTRYLQAKFRDMTSYLELFNEIVIGIPHLVSPAAANFTFAMHLPKEYGLLKLEIIRDPPKTYFELFQRARDYETANIWTWE